MALNNFNLPIRCHCTLNGKLVSFSLFWWFFLWNYFCAISLGCFEFNCR